MKLFPHLIGRNRMFIFSKTLIMNVLFFVVCLLIKPVKESSILCLMSFF